MIRPDERWLVSDGCHAPAYPCIAGRYYYHSVGANHQRARQPAFNAPAAGEWFHAPDHSSLPPADRSFPPPAGNALVACEIAPRVDIAESSTQQHLPHQTRLRMTVFHP